MPQGDDFITRDPTPAAVPVDPTPTTPAAPPSAPEVDDPAAPAPADPQPEPQTPDEPPDKARRRADAAFAAMRRENQALAARLAALEARQGQTDPTPTPAPAPTAAGDQPPQPEAFATHAAYVQAVAQWTVEQHQRTQAQQAEQTALTTAWDKQEAEAKSKHDDYDEALAADTTRYHPAVLSAIQTSELGAEVAYHLATHPEDAARISALAPAAAVRALGKLEARLEAAATPPAAPVPAPTPTPTPKPRPLTPVGGASSGGASVAPEAMDYDAYTAWYTRTFGSR
jgi:hypothetical protein